MRFSLVFATRGRVDLLANLISSLSRTTADPLGVEVIGVYDEDDPDTGNAARRLSSHYPHLNLYFDRRPRSSHLNRDYINHAAKLSDGKYIFVLNDDVEFLSEGWDELAWRRLEEFLSDKPDGIVYGSVDDSMGSLKTRQRMKYCGFPIVSRAAIDTVGYAMHPAFASWGADSHLFNLYSRVNRVCHLPEVRLLHLSPYTDTRPRDETHHHVARLCEAHSPQAAADSLDADAGKLHMRILCPDRRVARLACPAADIRQVCADLPADIDIVAARCEGNYPNNVLVLTIAGLRLHQVERGADPPLLSMADLLPPPLRGGA